MVLEGVHLVPGMLPPIEGALVVQCVLANDNADSHRAHFLIRDATTDGIRRQEKYLDRMEEIRRIQEHIVARAERLRVPVIANRRIDGAIAEVLELVLSGAEQVQRVS